MTTNESERERLYNSHTPEDQHPGCHTHSSGFGYIATYTEADKRIDAAWLRQARQRLVRVLAHRS